MIRENKKKILLFNMLSDVMLIVLSFYLSVYIRMDWMKGVRSVPLHEIQYAGMVVGYSCFLVICYYCQGLYNIPRSQKIGKEAGKIAVFNAVGTLALMALFFTRRELDISRLMMAIFYVTSWILLFIKRVCVYAVLHIYRKKGYNQKHVILVGNGHLACQYVQDIENNPQWGITIDGYLSKSERPVLGESLGMYEDIADVLEKHPIDEIVVALEVHETRFMSYILAAADKEGAHISLIPYYNDCLPAYPTIESLGRTKLINLRATPMESMSGRMLKRGMDIVGALVAIILTSPFMIFAAVGIKLTSPGPILFFQERVGKDKKPFKMIKFRSMRVDVPHDGWSRQNDPRKTKFGSFIRKYSIDELPQLFNVLKGEMSLIGPRPELPKFVRKFKEEVPLYLVRQQVRPGMTGWAQIHGLRGDTSIEDRVEYDIWYIENWSFELDMKILFHTVFGGFINQEVIETQKTENATSSTKQE